MNKKSKRLLKQKLYDKQRGVCFYCERKMVKLTWNNAHNERQATLDHIVPLSKGGEDAEDNIVCACIRCNRDKADMMPMDFLKEIGII